MFVVVKGNHFLHCLERFHNIFFVIPPQKVLEWAHLFLLPYPLQVMIILISSGGCLWQFQFDKGLFCGQCTFQRINVVRVFGFKKVTATKFTVRGVLWEKFCILLCVRVIKPFVGEKNFFSEVLYAFKNELLLRQESSLYPIAECHQLWTKWNCSLSSWQWVHCLIR